MFPSLLEKSLSASNASCLLFVDLVSFCVRSEFTKMSASDFGRRAEINLFTRPGHVEIFPFFTALIKVDLTGLKHVACKNLLTLLG